MLALTLLLTAVVPRLRAAGAAELNAFLERRRIERRLPPVPEAPDEMFLRRAYLKLTGAPPSPGAVRAFLRDRSPGKRAALIDRLLNSPEFSELMAMRYCQMFRVKSEFPINLWPNAVQLFHAYLRDAAAADVPYDKLVRDMLTASGSNFRSPGVNLLRAHADRSPAGVARGIALSLMGVRLEKSDRATVDGMAAFFSRIGRKDTDEWKEEVVFTLPEARRVEARTPDGRRFTIDSPAIDPRAVFADWLTARDNPWFARAFANRVWFWLFGSGWVEPADDLGEVKADLPGGEKRLLPRTTPELDFLAKAFRDGRCGVKGLFRTICNSRAFNADWRVGRGSGDAVYRYFAAYPVHRLEPELAVDALAAVTGVHDSYRSVIPEPFTILPPGTPAVRISDGSISSGTLDNFGRSPRDSGRLDEARCYVTRAQRQWLMNSGVLYGRLRRAARRVVRRERGDEARIDGIYLLALSRFPEPEERETIRRRLKSVKPRDRERVWTDVLWALVNTGEFLYHH